MSLLSWIPTDVGNGVPNPPFAIFDQNFAVGLLSEDLVHPHSAIAVPLRTGGYYRPWRHHATRHSGTSNIMNNKDGFKVNLDMQQFQTNEMTVKVVGDYIVVEAEHSEREDEHGFVSRSFSRRYLLPDYVEPDAVTTSLSSDGILTIIAPRAKPITAPTECLVPITYIQ